MSRQKMLYIHAMSALAASITAAPEKIHGSNFYTRIIVENDAIPEDYQADINAALEEGWFETTDAAKDAVKGETKKHAQTSEQIFLEMEKENERLKAENDDYKKKVEALEAEKNEAPSDENNVEIEGEVTLDREALEAKAAELDVTFTAKTKDATLAKRVDEALKAKDDAQ